MMSPTARLTVIEVCELKAGSNWSYLHPGGEAHRMSAAIERGELGEQDLSRGGAEWDGTVHPREQAREHACIQRLSQPEPL